jgi:hypothetical protein
VDLSKLSRGHWLVLGGTLGALFGTLIFPWYSASGFGVSIDVSAWSSGNLGKLAVLAMLLMVAGCIAYALNMADQLPLPLPMAMLGLGVFEALMPILKWIDVNNYTAFGLYLTIVAGIVAAYGAYELGGRINVPSTGSNAG